MQILYGLIAIALLVVAAAATSHEETAQLSVYFCQTQDCAEYMQHAIMYPEEVKCLFYDLDYPDLTELLQQKRAEVYVFEHHKYFPQVPSRGLMHHKFCVLDDSVVITGSTNPTENGLRRNDNVLIVINSTDAAGGYLNEYREISSRLTKSYEKQAGKIRAIPLQNGIFEVYFCPQDDCEKQVIKALSEARQNVRFLTFSFTSDAIGDYLLDLHAKGVDIQGVFEKRQQGKYNEYEKLLNAGIDVVYDVNPHTMHHKTFIVDERIVITGSYNPTESANTRNDENLLIIHDSETAAAFLNEFDRIWNISENAG